MSSHSPGEDIWINKHMERGSVPIAIREMEVQTLVSYYYTSIKWLKQKVPRTPKTGEDVEKLYHSHFAVET